MSGLSFGTVSSSVLKFASMASAIGLLVCRQKLGHSGLLPERAYALEVGGHGLPGVFGAPVNRHARARRGVLALVELLQPLVADGLRAMDENAEQRGHRFLVVHEIVALRAGMLPARLHAVGLFPGRDDFAGLSLDIARDRRAIEAAEAVLLLDEIVGAVAVKDVFKRRQTLHGNTLAGDRIDRCILWIGLGDQRLHLLEADALAVGIKQDVLEKIVLDDGAGLHDLDDRPIANRIVEGGFRLVQRLLRTAVAEVLHRRRQAGRRLLHVAVAGTDHLVDGALP